MNKIQWRKLDHEELARDGDWWVGAHADLNKGFYFHETVNNRNTPMHQAAPHEIGITVKTTTDKCSKNGAWGCWRPELESKQSRLLNTLTKL